MGKVAVMCRVILSWLLALLFVAGCKREAATPPPGDDATQAAATASPTGEPIALEDLIERDPRYIVGISYTPVAPELPGLAALPQAYAGAARADLDELGSAPGRERGG